jgi:pantoate--beta-alanine ligase
VLSAAAAVLAQEPGARLDYLALVDAETLLPVEEAEAGSLLAVAAHFGATRLIDNRLL